MRRLVALLVMVGVALAAPVQAAKAPPKKPAAGATKRKPCAKKPRSKRPRANKACAKKKPAKKPAAKKPATSVPAVPAPAATPALQLPIGGPAPVLTPDTPVIDPALGASPDPVPTPSPTESLSRILSVTEREFSLTLTHTTLGAGAIRVEVRNWGEDPHDLRIDGVGNPFAAAWTEMAPGDRITKMLTMSAGSYRLWCSLPNHAALGMDKPITVVAG